MAVAKQPSDDARPHWSVSQLNQFLNICSLQYWFGRVAKIDKETLSANLLFGSAVHETISCIYGHMRSGSSLTPPQAADAFAADWELRVKLAQVPVAYSGKDSYESLLNKGQVMIQHFMEKLDPQERVVSVDQRFNVPLIAPDGRALEKPLLGYFDLVVQRPSKERVVVDFKTASKRYTDTKIDNDLQSVGYAYAASLLFDQAEVDFEWRVLLKTKAPDFETYSTSLSRPDFERFAWLAQVVEHAVNAKAYLPNTQSFYCTTCPYRQACRDWHRGRTKTTVPVRAAPSPQRPAAPATAAAYANAAR